MIKTRIAPSPTGILHIGTARTALFNYLFAKQNNGQFFLRIEDTDASRNNQESYDSITNGLSWLGIAWDGDIIYQSKREKIHQSYANALIQKGLAYYSYISQEERKQYKCRALLRFFFYLY